jgi:hypothetical protein
MNRCREPWGLEKSGTAEDLSDHRRVRPRLRLAPEILHRGDLEVPGMRWPGFVRQASLLLLYHLLREEERP